MRRCGTRWTRLTRIKIAFPCMETSLLKLHYYFEFAFSALLLFVAAVNLVALRLARDAGSAIRLLSILNLVGVGSLLGLSIYFRVFQGIFTCVVLAILFLIALLRAATSIQS